MNENIYKFRFKFKYNEEYDSDIPKGWQYSTFLGPIEELFEIDKETIGMFSGLYDGAGNEIYEGDIIEWADGKAKNSMLVEFHRGEFGYMADGEDFIGLSENANFTFGASGKDSRFKIIGNKIETRDKLKYTGYLEGKSGFFFDNHVTLPFRADKEWGMYIWDANGNKIAMYCGNVDSEDYQKEMMDIERAINGEFAFGGLEDSMLNGRKFEYEGTNSDSTIYELFPDGTRKKIIVIRGWGYLTSKNCEGLSNSEAARIQDCVGKYFVKRLNGEK